jgi:hypothetical protein
MHEDAHTFLHASIPAPGKALRALGFARPGKEFMGFPQVLLFGV